MKDYGIEISGLTQSNTNWKHPEVGSSLNRAAHKKYDNYSYNTAIINFKSNNNSKYQPGGNIQICINHWTGRIMEHLYDPKHLGR
jgi:hypothetical protein